MRILINILRWAGAIGLVVMIVAALFWKPADSRSQTGEQVSEHGYVVVQRVGATRKRVHRVKLLADEQFSLIVTRRERLLIQAEIPGPPRSAALCEHCAYRSECKWGARRSR